MPAGALDRAGAQVADIGVLVLVIREQDRELAEEVLADGGLTADLADTPVDVVTGGASRQESELMALRHLAPAARHLADLLPVSHDNFSFDFKLKKLLLGLDAPRDVRNYVKERFQSALLLMKNIEQRKRTIVQVCQSVIARQRPRQKPGWQAL